MPEEVIIRRRNRLKKHFVNVSNVLLYGYKTLTDAAKITYQVIEGFDWEDKDTGNSKGFVFPAIETIAEIRNAGKRTIFRHIQELKKVGLLTRVRRRNKPSILYIEDVSDTEANLYLARYVDKAKQPIKEPETPQKSTSAKNGSSQKQAEVPKMAVAYEEKEPLKEYENNVNENLPSADPQKRSGMQGVGDILKRIDIQKQESPPRKTKKEKPEAILKRDYLADEIANTLGDQKSLGAFRKIAEVVPEVIIRQYLATIKETWQTRKIKKSRGALFISMIQQYTAAHQIELGFQSSG